MKKLLAMIVAMLLVLTMVSAIAEDHEPVTLTYWHTMSEGGETDAMNAIIDAFQTEYPWITVDCISMPYDGLKQQVILGAASGDAPDIMRMDIIWVPQFAAMDILTAVSDFEDFADYQDKYYAGPLSTCYYNGSYYGIPMNTNTLSGAWNIAMLEKLGFDAIPTTIDECLAVADALDEGEYLFGLGGSNTWNIFPWFYTLGGRYTNEAFDTATGYFNSPESYNAITTLVDWLDKGIISPCIVGGEPSQNSCMFEDKALVSENGPWLFTSNTEDDLAHVQPGLLPTGENGTISVVGGEDMVIFNCSEHQAEAWEFLKFVSNDFSQTQLGTVGGLVPTVAAVGDSEEVQNHAFYLPTFSAQLKTAQPRTPSPNWEAMSDKMNLFFEGCFRHEYDNVQEEMDALAAEMDVLLASTAVQ